MTDEQAAGTFAQNPHKGSKQELKVKHIVSITQTQQQQPSQKVIEITNQGRQSNSPSNLVVSKSKKITLKSGVVNERNQANVVQSNQN